MRPDAGASPVAADLLDHPSLERAVDAVLGEWGHVDVLVNNGRYIGPGHMDRILDTPVQLLRDHLEANALAPIVLIKAVVPQMIERGGGTIIDITSTVAYEDPADPAGEGGWGLGYAFSKGALHRIAGVLAVEQRNNNVRAYNVQPGFIATERIRQDMAAFGFDAATGAPAEVVAKACRWLLESPDARAMNGQMHPGPGIVQRARAAARLVAPPMTGAAGTRDKLLDAAARLFAERGIDNVSIAEIVRRAGQRNSSALHYHFGSRDAVLVALLERHIPDIRRRRLELLDGARAGPDDDTRAAAEAIVRPITEFAQLGWRERAYLQYGSELGQRLDRVAPEIRRCCKRPPGTRRGISCAPAARGWPRRSGSSGVAICTAFIGRAAADRAAQLDRGRASIPCSPTTSSSTISSTWWWER